MNLNDLIELVKSTNDTETIDSIRSANYSKLLFLLNLDIEKAVKEKIRREFKISEHPILGNFLCTAYEAMVSGMLLGSLIKNLDMTILDKVALVRKTDVSLPLFESLKEPWRQ